MICTDNSPLDPPLFNGNLLESTGCNWSIVDNFGSVSKINCDIVLKHHVSSGWSDERLGHKLVPDFNVITVTRKIYGLVPNTNYDITILLQKESDELELINLEYLKVIIGADNNFYSTTISKNSTDTKGNFSVITDDNGELVYHIETNTNFYLVRAISGSCVILENFKEYLESDPLNIDVLKLSDEEIVQVFSSSSSSPSSYYSSSSSSDPEGLVIGEFDRIIPIDNNRDLIDLGSSSSSYSYSSSSSSSSSSSYNIIRTPVGINRIFTEGNTNILLLSDNTVWGNGENLGNILLQNSYNIINDNNGLMIENYYNTLYPTATKITHSILGNALNIKSWNIGEIYEPNMTKDNTIPYCQVLDISGYVWSWGCVYNTGVTKSLIVNGNVPILRDEYPEIGRKGNSYDTPYMISSDNYDLNNGIVGIGQDSFLSYNDNFINYIGNDHGGLFGGGLNYNNDITVAMGYGYTDFIPKQIEIGRENSLILDTEGNVYSAGSLKGDTFVDISISGNLNNISHISSKFDASLLTKSDGTVYIYGDNPTFLDDNIYDSYINPTEVVKYYQDLYKTPKDMIHKNRYTVMIDSIGDVIVWGWWTGPGNAYVYTQLLPTKVDGISGAESVVVSDVDEILINTIDGKLYGTVNYRSTGAYILPGFVHNGPNFTELSKEVIVNEEFMDANEVIVSYSDMHVIGVSGNTYSSGNYMQESRLQESYDIDNIKKVVNVGNGDSHIVLKKDGTLWLQGSMSGYITGMTGYSYYVYPLAVPHHYFESYTQITTISDVYDVDANEYFVVAVLSNGDVYGWGETRIAFDYLGERFVEKQGYGYTYDSYNYEYGSFYEPTRLPDISGCKGISIDNYNRFIVALKSDNTLWGRGDQGTYMPIGNNYTTMISSFSKIVGYDNVFDFEVIGNGNGQTLIAQFYDGSISGSGYLQNFGIPTNSIGTPIGLGMTNVKKMAVHDTHMLTLLSNGDVWSIGQNSYNRLGLGDSITRSVFEKVPDINNIKDIGTNVFGSVLVTSDNKLKYVGYNYSGFYGYKDSNYTAVNFETLYLPVKKNDDTVFSDIDFMTCIGNDVFISKSNGDLYCWGVNNYNMLPVDDSGPINTPYKANISNLVKVQSNGSYSNTYLTSISGGTVSMRGYASQPPYSYYGNSNIHDVKDIACGEYYSIFLKNNGTVWGLGSNVTYYPYYSKRLYDKTETTVTSLTQILTGVDNVKSIISPRNGHTSMILTSDGALYTNMITNLSYSIITNISNIKNIYASGHVLTSNGELWNISTFGSTDYNDTVHKMDTGTDKISWISTVKNELSIKKYSMSRAPIFVKGDTRGLLSMGSNTFYEGGNISKIYHSTFTVVEHDMYDGFTREFFDNVKISKVGKDFSMVLTSDGEIYTAGKSNIYGQLGRELPDSNAKGYFLVSNLTSVEDIYCGEQHAVVKLSDGTIWAWGRNNYGQIATNDLISVSLPIQIGTISANKIAVGNNHNIVIDSNNEVYVWGRNDYGQLGTGEFDNKSSLYKWESQNYDITNIISNGDNTYYVKTDNIIYGTGTNVNGQLGQGPLDSSPKNTLVKIKKLKTVQNVKKLKCPYSHTICLYSTGEISTWGNNVYGELGVNVTNEIFNPVTPITQSSEELTSIKDVDVGKSYSMALTSTGEVWSWGDNLYGQLGHGHYYDNDEWLGINDMTTQSYNNSKVAKLVKELTPVYNVKSIGGMNKYNTFITTSFDNTLSVGNSEFSNFKYDDYIPSIFNETSISGSRDIIVQKDTYYLIDNGEVWSWGDGSFYRTILDTTDILSVPTKTILNNVKDIVSSDYNTYVLHSDNTLSGLGVKRQDTVSGNSNLPNISGGNSTISSILSVVDSEVSYISMGGNYTTLGYVKNGNVLFIGANRNNMWGIGSETGTNIAKKYISSSETESINNAISIDLGGEYSVVVDTSGDVYWSGFEYFTVLENSSYFKKVPNISDVQQVCPLHYKLLMRRTNGQLYSYDFSNNPVLIETNVLDIKYYANGYDNAYQMYDEGAMIHISGGMVKTSGMYNGYGRLGLFGNSTTSGLFEYAMTYQNMMNVKNIYCNKYNSYFLKSDNTLYGVGYNNSNLGKREFEYITMQNGPSNKVTDQLVFPKFLMDNVEDLIHSHDTVIAIISGGAHYIWGNMEDGQRGEGFGEVSGEKKRFFHNNYKELKLGHNHISMLTSSGDLYSWGSNNLGQTGLGRSNVNDYIIEDTVVRYSSNIPKQYFPELSYYYQEENNLRNIKSIQAGKDNIYIKKSDNSIWGWGNDNYRQSLGDSIESYNDNDLYKAKKLNNVNFSKENSPDIISKVQGEDITIKDIYLQDEYMVAIDTNGNAYSKGLTNKFSQLGADDSYRIDSLEPLYYNDDITVVNREDFILQDGTKEKWFDDDQLLLTYDTDNIVSVNFSVKKLIVGFKLIGLEFTGISSEDKVIIKFYGSDDDINKTMLGQTIVEGNRNLKQLLYNNTIMYSYYYVTFHKIENTLLEIINVTINNFEFFERTSVSSNRITDVSLGLYHSLYRLDDGTIYTLGNNLFGQLGNNVSNVYDIRSNLLTKVSDILNIKKIIASSYAQSFALASDGTLYGWGFNAHGELGISDRNNRLLPDIINVNGQIVKDIASSYKTAYAITSDNILWAWGDNEDGMIGDGTMVDRYSPTILTSDVVLVEANVSNVAYIKNDGSLWIWGYNKTGQLGNGTTDDSIVPLKVNIDNVMDVKFGKGVTYALKSDGTIWAWGNNDKGQLGQMMGDNTNVQEYLQKGYTLEPTINPSELLYNSNSDTVPSSISVGKGKNKYLPKMLTTLHESEFDANGWKREYVQTLLNKGFKSV